MQGFRARGHTAQGVQPRARLSRCVAWQLRKPSRHYQAGQTDHARRCITQGVASIGAGGRTPDGEQGVLGVLSRAAAVERSHRRAGGEHPAVGPLPQPAATTRLQSTWPAPLTVPLGPPAYSPLDPPPSGVELHRGGPERPPRPPARRGQPTAGLARATGPRPAGKTRHTPAAARPALMLRRTASIALRAAPSRSSRRTFCTRVARPRERFSDPECSTVVSGPHNMDYPLKRWP